MTTWFRRLFLRKHVHVWITDPDNWARRSCLCGARSFLMEKRYPKIGEPKYSWSDPL